MIHSSQGKNKAARLADKKTRWNETGASEEVRLCIRNEDCSSNVHNDGPGDTVAFLPILLVFRRGRRKDRRNQILHRVLVQRS